MYSSVIWLSQSSANQCIYIVISLLSFLERLGGMEGKERDTRKFLPYVMNREGKQFSSCPIFIPKELVAISVTVILFLFPIILCLEIY